MDYVSKLKEHADKNHFQLDYRNLGHEGPDHCRTYTMMVILNERPYPEGVGKNKKEAKQRAAQNALKGLWEDNRQPPADSKSDAANIPTPAEPTEESNQAVSDSSYELRCLSLKNSHAETNYIGIVNNCCQKKGLSPEYIKEKRFGPSHDPTYFYKLVVDGKSYPVGEGKSVKEAKQAAALLFLNEIKELPNWNNLVLDICRDVLTASQVPARSTVSKDETAPPSSNWSSSLEGQESSSLSRNLPTISANPPSAQSSQRHKSGTQSRFKTDFEPLENLGMGGFGSVFKAKHKLAEKLYAVKIIRCEEKCLREVETLSELQHHNIVRYYNCWMEDSAYESNTSADSCSSSTITADSATTFLYIQMELCQSNTLKDWIEEKNFNSPPDSRRSEKSLGIAQQIVEGVEYIHKEKYIHRDLKPGNIFFTHDETVKIGDFGLVTEDDDDDSLVDRTVSHGTPTYMAPEQNTKNYGRKVDIFSLGLIFLELLWKVSSGSERAEVLRNARSQRLPQKFSQAFPDQNFLIKSMLCEKPEGRPQASQIKAELGKLTDRKRHLESVTV